MADDESHRVARIVTMASKIGTAPRVHRQAAVRQRCEHGLQRSESDARLF